MTTSYRIETECHCAPGDAFRCQIHDKNPAVRAEAWKYRCKKAEEEIANLRASRSSASEGADRYAEGWRAAREAAVRAIKALDEEECEGARGITGECYAQAVRALSPSPLPTEPEDANDEPPDGWPCEDCGLPGHACACDEEDEPGCVCPEGFHVGAEPPPEGCGVDDDAASEAQPPRGTEHRCTGPGDCDARGEDHQRRNNEGEG